MVDLDREAQSVVNFKTNPMYENPIVWVFRVMSTMALNPSATS